MKSLACRDFGIDCNFTARADAAETVIEKTLRHTRATHPHIIKKASKEMIERNIRIRLATRIREKR